MKIIEKRINLNNKDIPNNSIFLDIETTGFSRLKNRIYLMGTLAKEGDDFIFRQFLTEFKGEEKELLRKTINLLKNFDTIITFNGQTFDLGFIEQRSKIHNIDFNFKGFNHLDIYREIQNKGFMLGLENNRLKTIEKYLGINREDIFSGGELIQLYYEYESGNRKLELPLLLHNEEDVINMPRLMEIFKIIEDKNRIIVRDHYFDIENISIRKKEMEIIGESTIERAYFNELSSELTISEKNFNLISLIQEGNYSDKIKCTYIEKNGLDLKCHYDYASPNEILLLKYDKEVLYNNAYNYFKKYLETLF